MKQPACGKGGELLLKRDATRKTRRKIVRNERPCYRKKVTWFKSSDVRGDDFGGSSFDALCNNAGTAAPWCDGKRREAWCCAEKGEARMGARS